MKKRGGTQFPKRRSMRLPYYDYTSPGGYFLTICTHNRSCLLGEVSDGQMRSYETGRIVKNCWLDLPNHYPNAVLDVFIVMPNHVHGLLFINKQSSSNHALPEIIRAFKSFSARQVNKVRNTQGRPLWQRGYFERIIRGPTSLEKTREYISNNPLRWHLDRNNPTNFEFPGNAGRSETGPYTRKRRYVGVGLRPARSISRT